MSNIVHQFAEKVTRSPFLGGLAGIEYRTIELDITEENLNVDDEWHFLKLPTDVIIVDVFLGVDDLDSNGAATLTLDVGIDGGSEFLTADTTAQTGGFVAATGGLPVLPADAPSDWVTGGVEGDGPFLGEEGQVLTATVAAAPATAEEGKAVLTVGYCRTRQR